MQLGGAFALAFVLIAIVRDLFENGGEWATVAAYATLLRQLLANATNIFRAVTVFSRLTPHISAFRAFVMAADQAGKCIPPPMPDSLRIQAKEMNGSATTTLLARGTCFRIMTATPFGRGVAMDLQRALLAANARAGGERTQAPRIPAIGTFSAADALLGKTGDLERQLVGAVTDHQGILLLPEPQYAQLSDSGRSRLLEHAAHVALGLVSKPSRAQIAAGSLLLICDRSTTWHWLRVPVSGLTASTRRDIEKLAKQGDRKAKAMADLDEIG
jgi:hypothetical protein